MAFVGIICMTSLSVKIRGGPEIIGATMSAKAWASAGGYCAVRLLKYAPVSSLVPAMDIWESLGCSQIPPSA